MPVVQPTQIAAKSLSEECTTSPSTKRVPLRALQMLTQSVSPLMRDYVQPFPISEGNEQKKSPLALLAATCSSIGKTEAAKGELREAVVGRRSPKTTPSNNESAEGCRLDSLNKIGADETKSSFKPYRHHDEAKEASHHRNSSTPEKPGFRTPSKESSDSLVHSTPRKSPEFRPKAHVGSYAPFQYPYLTDSASAQCFYQAQSRLCGMYFDMGDHQLSGHHGSCLKTDCSGNCGTMIPAPPVLPVPSSLSSNNPTTPSTRSLFPSLSIAPATTPVKSHGLPSSTSPRANPLYPRCNCGYCNQAVAGQEASLKGVQHAALSQYHRDYLQSSASCHDPYCSNCKSPSTAATVSGASNSRGCGPYCFHHHYHDNATALPASLPSMASPAVSHLYPYGFMLRPQSSDQASPFVCNWVQDSKSCGKTFTTSDELLQHLRTHTSTANSTAPPLHTQCNIAGCPCNLKSLSSGSSRLHPARYHPYLIPNPGVLHSSTFHSAITPYSSPHGIPFGSPFKPY